MSRTFVAKLTFRERLADVADGMAIATVIMLPWTTTGAVVLLGIWVLVLVPSLRWSELRREILTPAGGLPVLLFALGVLGMAWADVPLPGRWAGVSSFFRLLMIPALFAQFRRSEMGLWVLVAYVASCTVLLAVSSVITDPSIADAVLVKNGATQSGEFVTCIFGLLYIAVDCAERRRWWWLAGLTAVMLGMVANMVYVANGRTALVVIPVLLFLFALKRLSAKGAAVLFAGAIAIVAIAWVSSPYLRERVVEPWKDYVAYKAHDARTSMGERIEFYKKSLHFIADAPVFGNGTGTINKLFAAASSGTQGSSGVLSNNPHNQTFAVAIQIGLLGALLLWAMWIAHALMFRGPGLIAWVGSVVVVQNIVGSLGNSHLFDFVQGWVYVLGVGIAGGMALKQADRAEARRKK